MTYTLGSSPSCSGKKRYNSYWGANRASKRLLRHRDGTKANPYRCEDCHNWHVGNTAGKLRRRQNSRHDEKERYRRGRI
jgi:hypothetical protein